MKQFGLAYRVLPGAGINSQHNLMRRFNVEFLHHADDFLQLFHQVRFVLQASGGIGNQDVDITRFSGLNGVEDNRGGIRTGMLGNHRNIVALTPDLKLFNRCRTESIARRQHHRFTLLLKLTRQLTNRRGFTHTVDAYHQDHERRFTFNIQRLIDFRQNLAHLFFQQAIERLGITKLLAGCAFRQIGDNFTCGFHAHIGDQQLLFQLFKQIIVDFFTAEQADKSGTEVFFGF